MPFYPPRPGRTPIESEDMGSIKVPLESNDYSSCSLLPSKLDISSTIPSTASTPGTFETVSLAELDINGTLRCKT